MIVLLQRELTLAEFESTVITRATVVSRAMKCKAPIHAEAWDEVVKYDAKVEAAFDQLLVYMNEFNFQMTKATANAAPAHHAITEAKYNDDLGNPFAVSPCISYSRPLLTSTCRRD